MILSRYPMHTPSDPISILELCEQASSATSSQDPNAHYAIHHNAVYARRRRLSSNILLLNCIIHPVDIRAARFFTASLKRAIAPNPKKDSRRED